MEHTHVTDTGTNWAYFTQPALEMLPWVAFLAVVWAAVLGAFIGSFLNVVIARLPVPGESIVRPRSRCPSCRTLIAWYDNIPMLSWLILRARCRHCGNPISWRYPFVELLLALAAAIIALRVGMGWVGLELFVFTAILVAITYIDLDTFTIPLVLCVPLVPLGWLFGALGASSWEMDVLVAALTPRLIGAGAGFLALASILVIGTAILRRTGRLGPDEFAMGWGDPILLAGIGAFIGWRFLPWAIFLASFQGAIIGAIQLRRGAGFERQITDPEDDWVPDQSAVPFGPFLSLAALEIAFLSEEIGALSQRLFQL
jgi:leader peptidase (prepilin peptidase)/N-methyltransferase